MAHEETKKLSARVPKR